MKQKLFFLLVVLSFLLPAPLLAYNFESGGIYYDRHHEGYDNDGNPIYVAYVASSPEDNKYSGDLVIPSTVEYEGQTLSVTSIGDWAFRVCTSLTSIELPNTMTYIGRDAFNECTSLATIKIPNSVTSIGNYTFYRCSSLVSIELPNSVTSIGEYAFFCCTSLVSVEIPNSVTSIGRDAFSGCASLASVEIPNSMTSIGNSTFAGCASLASVEIPNSVTSIEESAFSGCTSLASVELPNSVTSIGAWAFAGCISLTSVRLPNTLTSIDRGVFERCTSLISVEIPNTLTSIANETFDGCTSLTSVKIPNTVTSIGAYAFKECTSLASVELPNSVTSIEDWVFQGCTSLASVELPNTVTSIGVSAFSHCTSLASVELPNTVTSIGVSAFSHCTSLASVELPNTVTSIGKNVFQGCTSLASVELPNSLTSIEEWTFGGCTSLVSVEIPNSVTSIGERAFSSCSSLASIAISNSVTSIGERAFYDCNNLRLFLIWGENITFNNPFSSYLKNPDYIFAPEGGAYPGLDYEVRRFTPAVTTCLADWTLLTDNGKTLLYAPLGNGPDYAIPEGVTKITSGSMAYREETLASLTIPSTIREIEPDVFLNTKIEKVNFTDWTKWYSNAKLGNLYSNPYWNSTPYVGGVQMVTPELTDGMTEITDYINYGLQFKNEIELPRSIKRIGAYAFYNNKELSSVILPSTLEEIGESAFEGCELLENPSFPVGLKKIEDGVYKDCTSITEIVLPEGLTTLGSRPSGTETTVSNATRGVFGGCTALEKAVVVVDIDYLADNLFMGCQSLNKVYFPLQLKTIGNNAFANCRALDEITLPATLESIGESAFKSGSISKLVIPDGVKSIGREAFSNQGIATLSIGSGLDIIPDKAFCGNSNLTVIHFSEGLKEIEEQAFSFGGNIGSIVLPSTVTRIGDNAFRNVSIGSLVIPDGVESLGSGSCGNPSVLTIGSAIKEIAADAFNFEKLYTIRLKAHMPPSLSAALPLTTEQNDQLTLIVNKGRHDTYNTNARWKQIDRIIEEGDSEVEIHLDGSYSLAEEIRMQSGYMPSVVTKMTVDGPLSDNDLRVIKANMVSLTSLDLSHVTNLTALPERQFEGSLLTNVVLPTNLESIGDYAFSSCRLLELTELPASVRSIGYGAFSSCPKVNITTLPVSLERIGDYAFSGTGMLEVVAGEALTELGAYAFENCKLLERADLEATGLTEIAGSMFSGCSELDEVILPPTVETIGSGAFSGTAIRNIDFASGVTEIGDYAFSGNRRLVSAILPTSLTSVGSNLFADCPRLISLSMPGATTSVGTKVVSNDRKLASLSCSAQEAPEAATGAFDDLRYRYVTLTIPTLSFRKYLNAPQWGKFESMKNTIKVNMGKGLSVTSAAEDEYQDMLTEDALEAAQEAAAAQGGKLSPARAMRRAAARAKTTQNFATVFDGAQLMSGSDGGANRIFITTKPGVTITSILLDGEPLLESFDGQSVLLPEGKSGTLEIITDAPPTLTESITLSDDELTLTFGETVALTATVEPADTEDKTVTWSSSDDSIAEVDENGEVTIVGVGKATITASCGEVSSECSLTCYPQLGDANWNGSITVADAVDITNYVVRKKTAPENWNEEEWTGFYVAGANVNGSEDGSITFADASATVTLALAQPSEASDRNRLGTPYRGANISSDALVLGAVSATSDGRTAMAINLANTIEYVALQADITVPEGITVDVKAGKRAASHSFETMRFADNHIRVAIFNLGNKAFAEGNDPLFEILADADMADVEGVRIFNILAADSDANEYALGTVMIEEVSGVDGISNDGILISTASDGIHVSNTIGNRIEICTMDGRIVESFVANDTLEIINLPAGIYIVRAAGKTIKVIL